MHCLWKCIVAFINVFARQILVVDVCIYEAGSFHIELIQKATFEYAIPDYAVNMEIWP
jgi:hypothetical protein